MVTPQEKALLDYLERYFDRLMPTAEPLGGAVPDLDALQPEPEQFSQGEPLRLGRIGVVDVITIAPLSLTILG